MQDEINAIKQEVIQTQKQQVLKEVAVLQLHCEFKEQMYQTKLSEAETDEVKEHLENNRRKEIPPMKDNIDLKSKYYDYLCNLESSDTESAAEESQDDTSEER